MQVAAVASAVWIIAVVVVIAAILTLTMNIGHGGESDRATSAGG